MELFNITIFKIKQILKIELANKTRDIILKTLLVNNNFHDFKYTIIDF